MKDNKLLLNPLTMTEMVSFRPLIAKDWERVREIYRHGIETGNATFQTEVPTWNDWDTNHFQKCRIIAELTDHIVGWAALSPISSRAVYSGVAEVSVYVAPEYGGRHFGIYLLEKLLSESEKAGFWTLQASIFQENKASLAIHEKLEFRLVGYREKIGQMDGRWRDTLLLERRSKLIK
ncbi:MAG TPA: N-acetyltransferase family protein [Saprospiraceae bacterium]|nr:N-acetyltransferase family protein [Saprospiraceae bacterium]HQW55083.1 N-acetyltransferase family protein [Saprospiraceae bacterium]